MFYFSLFYIFISNFSIHNVWLRGGAERRQMVPILENATLIPSSETHGYTIP